MTFRILDWKIHNASRSFGLFWQKHSCTFLDNFGGYSLQNSWGETSIFIQRVQEIYFVKCQDSLIYGHLGSLQLKKRGVWGWFIPKTFQGLHFLFSGELIWLIYIFELFACETNLQKKRSVFLCVCKLQIANWEVLFWFAHRIKSSYVWYVILNISQIALRPPTHKPINSVV